MHKEQVPIFLSYDELLILREALKLQRQNNNSVETSCLSYIVDNEILKFEYANDSITISVND